MDIQYLLEQLILPTKVVKIEQKGGVLTFIGQMIVKIISLVFEKILLPLAQVLFQPPDFYKLVDGKDEDGNPIKVKKFRTKYKVLPNPKYTPELEGQGLFWKYLKLCFKFSWAIIVGMLGGIYILLFGMIYLVVKIFNDFTEKKSYINKNIQNE